MEKLTEQKLAELKAKHGALFLIEVDGKECLLRRPMRQELSLAAKLGASDPLKYNEVILTNCWLAGDEEIRIDDALFLGVSGKLGELIEIKEATLKKL